METNCLKTNIGRIHKGCKDNFHAFMVDGARFDGYYDIPYIPQVLNVEIKKLISYDKTYNHIYEDGEVVHFYIDDQKFDGPKGIWSGITNNEAYKRGFNLARFDGATAIIAPDFSLYLDMPRCMQIWNVYRSRAVGYYLSQLGFNVIPNVRWSDESSYDFAFGGLYNGQTVAVGTLGCSKEKTDKVLLVNGFIELVRRVKPNNIIVYGPICNELKYVIDRYEVNVSQFDSDTQSFYRGNTYGNEE